MHNKVFKKICNIFLDILIGIFGLILLVTIYNDIQVKVFKKSYADFFGYSTFEVQTGSMAPTINANDLIIVKKDNSPKVKDIITYKNGNDFITHRVVESYKETYVTKGDANNAKDEAIKKDQIVGRVVKIIPNFGAIRKTLLNPIVLITLIVTAYIISRLFSNKESFIKKIISKKNNKEAKDLENTVSVNLLEQVDISKEDVEDAKKVIESIDIPEEDLDKTIYFRKISVDSSELNPVIPVKEEVVEDEPLILEDETTEDDSQDKIKSLKKRHKKFNDIIEKVMFIKESELNEIIEVLSDSKLKPNEATIKDSFLKIYIDGKYYNHCGNINTEYNSKNICSKLEEVFEKEATKMINEYSGTDTKYKTKVLKYMVLQTVVMHIEHINSLYEDIDIKVAAYKKKIAKYLKYDEKQINKMLKEIVTIQRVYKKVFKDTLDGVESNTFILNYNQLTTKKNVYGLVLDHNISFSKVYSNYIISKTYDEGVVAEDKVLVILDILLNKIAKDMIEGNFKDKYLLYLPSSIYEKENKLNHILKLLSDEFVKNSVLILVKSSVIVNKKKLFKDIKKLGYNIAVVYDGNQIKEKDNSIYSVATYLFVDKKVSKTLSFDMIDPNIVVLENILGKVDIPGGEE